MSDKRGAHSAPHPYHLVNPSPWPALGAVAAFALAFGGIQYMRGGSAWWLAPGVLLVLFTMFAWWRDVVREATVEHAHTDVVRHGLRVGMALFIVSEVMFFVAFFWAFFNASLGVNPSITAWPPAGIEPLPTWDLPFFNTLVLLTSGLTLNWGHHALRHGDRRTLTKALAITVGLGILFLAGQIYEYGHAAFGFRDGVYPSVFYMATGFHGFHVFVGVCFLAVNLFRTLAGHFSPAHHVGFEAAAWYWHFVDVVWLFLFVWVYWWGNG